MNLTLSVDEQTVERARAVAQEQGTSLNALIREFLERLAGRPRGAEIAGELRRLWAQPGARSRSEPYRFRREDAYDTRRTGGGRG
ncbi:MAG TPA: DUF6364 family protein [Kofleriaceae bacterium]|jgi:hypothetical protein|nr:DUF6364 family protein [Kofleriaceae bacterium]